MIKRLLEQGDAAQVGVGKMDVPKGLYCFIANAAPYEVWYRAYHRVAPAHYVDPLGQLANISMRPAEIGQANIREVAPIVTEELLTPVRFAAHGIIIRQDR